MKTAAVGCLPLIVALASCKMLEPYEVTGPAADSGQDVIDSGDAPPPDSHDLGDGSTRWPDGPQVVIDGGQACTYEVDLWRPSCRAATSPPRCAIACSGFTLVCLDKTCSCALENFGARYCDDGLGGAASCDPDSICYEAAQSGCCSLP